MVLFSLVDESFFIILMADMDKDWSFSSACVGDLILGFIFLAFLKRLSPIILLSLMVLDLYII